VSTATGTAPHGVLVLTGSVEAGVESLLVGHTVDVGLRAVGLVGRLRRVRPAVLRGTGRGLGELASLEHEVHRVVLVHPVYGPAVLLDHLVTRCRLGRALSVIASVR
jgi:hypothetical protein